MPVLLPDQIDMPASFDGVAEGRLDARLGRHHRDGRDHLHGLGGEEPAALLQARVVRQVHAVPRRRRLAVQDPDGIERGEGEMRDIDLLLSVGNNIVGKTLCAFGDAAATPVLTTSSTSAPNTRPTSARAAAPCRPTGARRAAVAAH